MPLDMHFGYPGTRMPTLGQLHGYAAALTSSYDPHLFNHPNQPLVFRNLHIPPHPDWYHPDTFTIEQHGQYYDYIVVHPTHLDPLYRKRYGRGVSLIKEAGAWRLYKVTEKQVLPLCKPVPRSVRRPSIRESRPR